jgi:outer membrane protein, multidrug efflux system
MTRHRRDAGAVCAAAASLLVCACAPVGPNYVRTPVPTPAQYRFVTDPAQGESIADAPWWQVFDDPALHDLIYEAIRNNLDVRAAAARVEQARAQAGIARSFLYPQVDGSAAYTFQQNSGGSDKDVQQSGVYGLQLSWELDLFGRLRRQKEAAVAEMLASEQGRRGVLVTLVGDVASTYFLLRELDLELQIARRTLQVNDRTVVYFQDRLDGGVSNRLEVDRIKSNRSQTAAAIPDFEQQIAIAENGLSLLLGRTPGAIDRTATTMETGLGAAPPIPPGLPASLLERRPDVVQAEQHLVAANANVGAAKALFFPAVNLTGFLGAVSGDLTTLLGGSGAVWSLGGGLLQPIVQGGRLRRNLEAARAAVDEAVAQYRQAALNGYREVANALVAIQKLAQIRIERQAAVDVLRDASDLARSRYESGLATYLEILDADQQLFQQEVLLAQARGAELQARADLYRALGGGWQP